MRPLFNFHVYVVSIFFYFFLREKRSGVRTSRHSVDLARSRGDSLLVFVMRRSFVFILSGDQEGLKLSHVQATDVGRLVPLAVHVEHSVVDRVLFCVPSVINILVVTP